MRMVMRGIGDYKDLDADGFIYIGGIKPGNYYVSLQEADDYRVPEKVKVSVKDKIEFVKLDDISYLIKTEDEIDAEAEDTANHQADADDSEHTDAWDNRQDAVLGIDVSKWNKTIDWEKVKESGVRFVIIRCGYRGSKTGVLVEDPYFRQNIQGAKDAGLKVGVYFFTQAINQAEAVEEASMVLSLTEGYELEITNKVGIKASTAQGIFWGTRTLLQMLYSQGTKLAKGSIRDWPEFPNRGFMLDVGRKFFTLDYLKQQIKVLSFYKMNEFQIHLVFLNSSTMIGTRPMLLFVWKVNVFLDLQLRMVRIPKRSLKNYSVWVWLME